MAPRQELSIFWQKLPNKWHNLAKFACQLLKLSRKPSDNKGKTLGNFCPKAKNMSAHYTTPQVKSGRLRYRTKNGRKTEFHEITVGSPAWFSWLEDNPHFNVETYAGSFHARKEKRRNRFYWYGVKKILGQVKKKYLGASAKLNNKTLYEAALQLSSVTCRSL